MFSRITSWVVSDNKLDVVSTLEKNVTVTIFYNYKEKHRKKSKNIQKSVFNEIDIYFALYLREL